MENGSVYFPRELFSDHPGAHQLYTRAFKVPELKTIFAGLGLRPRRLKDEFITDLLQYIGPYRPIKLAQGVLVPGDLVSNRIPLVMTLLFATLNPNFSSFSRFGDSVYATYRLALDTIGRRSIAPPNEFARELFSDSPRVREIYNLFTDEQLALLLISLNLAQTGTRDEKITRIIGAVGPYRSLSPVEGFIPVQSEELTQQSTGNRVIGTILLLLNTIYPTFAENLVNLNREDVNTLLYTINEIAAPEPVQAQPVQAQPVQAQPVQAQPVQAQPVQAQPVQAQPVQAPLTPAAAPITPSRPVSVRQMPGAPSRPTRPDEKKDERLIAYFPAQFFKGNNQTLSFYSSYLLDDLKDILYRLNLPIGGKKDVLLERLIQKLPEYQNIPIPSAAFHLLEDRVNLGGYHFKILNYLFLSLMFPKFVDRHHKSGTLGDHVDRLHRIIPEPLQRDEYTLVYPLQKRDPSVATRQQYFAKRFFEREIFYGVASEEIKAYLDALGIGHEARGREAMVLKLREFIGAYRKIPINPMWQLDTDIEFIEALLETIRHPGLMGDILPCPDEVFVDWLLNQGDTAGDNITSGLQNLDPNLYGKHSIQQLFKIFKPHTDQICAYHVNYKSRVDSLRLLNAQCHFMDDPNFKEAIRRAFSAAKSITSDPNPAIPDLQIRIVNNVIGGRSYPRFVCVYKGLYEFSTPPFGLNIDPPENDYLIQRIDGVEPGPYYAYYAACVNLSSRKMMYAFSQHRDFIPIVHPYLNREKITVENNNWYIGNIISFAHLIDPQGNVMSFEAIINALDPPREINWGKIYRVVEFIEQHPQYQNLYLPRIHPILLDYSVDKLTPELIRLLPPGLASAAITPDRIVPNPYSNLSGFAVETILGEREQMPDQNPETLRQLDTLLPEWRDNLLRRPLYDVITRGDTGEILFLLACYGYEVGRMNLTSRKLIELLVTIAEAGRPGNDQTSASPIKEKQFNDLLNYYTPSNKREEMVIHLLRFMNVPRAELLDEKQAISIFTRGYINPVPIPSEYGQRIAIWDQLSDEQRQMIGALYVVQENERERTFIKRSPVSPIEQYIINWYPNRLDELIEKFEFFIPPYVDRRQYVRDALSQCHGYITRERVPSLNDLKDNSDNVFLLSDREIVFTCNAIFGHKSRTDLFKLAKQFLENVPMFFIAQPPYNPVNKFFISTNISDVFAEPTNDPNLPMVIGYGSYKERKDQTQDYVAYLPGEIIGAMTTKEEGGALTVFRRFSDMWNPRISPVPIYSEVEPNDVAQLRRVLKIGVSLLDEKETQEIQAAITVIDSYLELISGLTLYDIHMTQAFAKITDLADRQNFHDALMNLFLMGMYFRQWRGPGNPYPVKADTTRDTRGFDKDASTAKAEAEFIMAAEKLGIDFSQPNLEKMTPAGKIFFNLNIVAHLDGAILQYSKVTGYTGVTFTTVGGLLKDILEGQFCIRVGSKYVVGTGHYYLRSLFHEDIPDYDPKRLESIL